MDRTRELGGDLAKFDELARTPGGKSDDVGGEAEAPGGHHEASKGVETEAELVSDGSLFVTPEKKHKSVFSSPWCHMHSLTDVNCPCPGCSPLVLSQTPVKRVDESWNTFGAIADASEKG